MKFNPGSPPLLSLIFHKKQQSLVKINKSKTMKMSEMKTLAPLYATLAKSRH